MKVSLKWSRCGSAFKTRAASFSTTPPSNVPFATPTLTGLAAGATFVSSGNMLNYNHIQATSPVKKTGSIIWAPPFDMDGEPRRLFASMGVDQIPFPVDNLFLPLINR